MGIVAVPLGCKHAQVHDMFDARFFCLINDGLALNEHRDCVTGEQEQSLHPPQRLSKSSGIVKIKVNSLSIEVFDPG